jgi:hypothetical protein
VVRMDGFSWGKKSDRVYYSHWHSKADVKNGKAPIVEVRSRSLATGQDTLILDHSLPENFEIYDVDGGKTLVAHRILGAAVGIKVVFTGFIGRWNESINAYDWEMLPVRSENISAYLGVIGKGNGAQMVLATDKVGSNYGLVTMPLKKLKAGEVRQMKTLLAADRKLVLHMPQMVNGHLILQYNNPATMEIVFRIYDIQNMQLKSQFKMSDFGLDKIGVATLWNIQGSANRASFNFFSVSTGAVTLEYNFSSHAASRLPNAAELNLDLSDVRSVVTQIRSSDGTMIPAHILYPVDKSGRAVKPRFVFVRTYGAISVINRAEAKEAQMVLDMGGAYIAASVRGGGEKGAQWFYAGAKDKLKTIADIAAVSDFARTGFAPWKRMKLTKNEMVALGRSWGGLHSLLLAFYHPDSYAMIHSIVPVVNLEDFLYNGWFGRVASSDLAPEVDTKNGDLILENAFWKRVETMDPWIQAKRYNGATKLFIGVSQYDDRVDQQFLAMSWQKN